MSEAQRIAEALTDAQAELLMNVAYPVTFGVYFSSTTDERALVAAGLVTDVQGHDVPEATPLGFEVARYMRALADADEGIPATNIDTVKP